MDPTSILLLVAAAVAFFFLIIRPQRKRQAAQQAMQKALAPGAEIMTSAGIFGTVAAVTDEALANLAESPRATLCLALFDEAPFACVLSAC